jgi:hypothetical protein
MRRKQIEQLLDTLVELVESRRDRFKLGGLNSLTAAQLEQHGKDYERMIAIIKRLEKMDKRKSPK